MSQITSGHPSRSALAAFALGKLDAQTAEKVHNHLAGCPDCRTVVETTPNDTLLGLLKNAAGRPGDTPSLAASILKGTLAVPNPDFDMEALPAELRDHPRYRILRKLGEGGMGAVYEAEHRMMERIVAIKMISASLVDSPAAIERFEREVRAAAKLEHANIVRAYDADQAGGTMLLAMEFVKGRTLAEVIASKGPLPVAYACQCVRQAALGLQHAADHQMVHRDIKPQNLMLTEKGVVKILDFGLAKLASERLSRPGLTGKDMVMGTPEYMAPEQARDTASADIRADIYALGCTLFCLLTGRPPFTGATAIEIVTKQVIDAPPRVTDLRPEAPAELADLIGRMLAKDPAERPQSPKELAEALAPFTRAVPKAAPLPPKPLSADGADPFVGLATQPARPASRPVTRRRWLIPTAVAAGVFFIASAWAAIVLFVKTPDGIVTVQIDPPDAKVEVAEGAVTIRPRGENEPFTITVAKGGGKLRISKAGFEVLTKEVTLSDKGTTIKAKLEPVPVVRVPKPIEPPPAPADGFVSLFNGKDVTGWKSLSTSRANWEVKDGVLTGRGDTGYLFSDGANYENFHLRVEAMINDGGNSGVFFRAPFGPTTPQGHPAGGYEAQINITHKDPVKTGSLFLAQKVATRVPQTFTDLDEWFTLEIIAEGPHVVVMLNGKVTANYISLALGARSGHVALQVLDAATVVKFRKIEIAHLPPGDLRLQYPQGPGRVVEQVKGNVWLERNGNWLGYFREHARNNDDDGGGTVRLNRKIENNKTGIMHITRGNGAWWNVQGTPRWTQIAKGGWSVLPRGPTPEKSPVARVDEWTPLLNGKDLSGWETAGNKNGTWTYEDDAIVGRSSAERAGLLLSDRADYENLHIRMETRLSENACSSLFVRCGPPIDGTAGNKCYAVRIGESTGGPPVTGTLVLSAHFDEAAPLALADAANVILKPGEWFPMEVIAVGNRFRVLVDGKTVVDYVDKNETFTTGRIGLVCRGKAVARFRKVEVKELR
jgi:hypothetical protein